jgi:hypothetical protein
MPAVHRNGDSRSCGATTIVTGQGTVYVNNKLVSVQGDKNTHINGALLASVNPGTVFAENKEIVVVGSDASGDNSGHNNPKAASGSGNVFAFS